MGNEVRKISLSVVRTESILLDIDLDEMLSFTMFADNAEKPTYKIVVNGSTWMQMQDRKRADIIFDMMKDHLLEYMKKADAFGNKENA